MTLTEFLLARIAEDEAVAMSCAEMFPTPWDISDRGWRIRIYASDVPTEDFSSDDPDAMTTRNPVVMEVEPDRHIEDPTWLSERVEHITRHDPAHVLAECAAKHRIVEEYEATVVAASAETDTEAGWIVDGQEHSLARVLRFLAMPYAEHPDYDPEWRDIP